MSGRGVGVSYRSFGPFRLLYRAGQREPLATPDEQPARPDRICATRVCAHTHHMSQSSSTPIWVPIVVGAIGLVGVLLSALLTQWLAGRRAAEERRAADAREERQRQDLREAREAALQWDETMRKYELRREAYATLALSLRRWVDVIQTARARHKYGNPPDNEQKEALRPSETATEKAGASVDLLGSKPVRGAYRTTWARFSLTTLQIGSRYRANAGCRQVVE